MTENDEAEKAAGYFQRPSFNALERLICSHLIEGINATPLDTTLHTTQAALLLDDTKMKNLEIDRDQVLSIYTVAQRLKDAGQQPKMLQTIRENPYVYSLSSSSLDYEKDLKPWLRGVYSCKLPLGTGEKLDELQDAYIEASDEEKEVILETIYRVTIENLGLTGYQKAVSDFLFYATPIVQTIGGKLAGTVSPESYLELFRLIKGDKP